MSTDEQFPGDFPDDFTVNDIEGAPIGPGANEQNLAEQLELTGTGKPAFDDIDEAKRFARRVGNGILDRLFVMGAEDAYTLRQRLIELEAKEDQTPADLSRLSTVFDNERRKIIQGETGEEIDELEVERLKKLSDFAEAVAYISAASVASALGDKSTYSQHIEGIIDEAEEKTDLAQVDDITKRALRVLVDELRGRPEDTD